MGNFGIFVRPLKPSFTFHKQVAMVLLGVHVAKLQFPLRGLGKIFGCSASLSSKAALTKALFPLLSASAKEKGLPPLSAALERRKKRKRGTGAGAKLQAPSPTATRKKKI